ncbi:hypothetical protein I3843_16G021300 [Carya illinoinensis]|uniref:Uncharacterized protein n=1 Tax=Carya illinoinensis TaxID=32201 RepID=A0A8T1N517_CARIL|nr:uncharacterized protein LOC122299942 [Carya illinoinensis]KAG2663258.1 hypothetical protein I3760_16G019000 [Carya illinoinensis]KAG6624340.1 hypothetical protein CIPAW_16G019600 [Carya illinoinensis]KAG7941106.1 hypothetical protein I3843_16G021300 [Carya illinoinensis]
MLNSGTKRLQNSAPSPDRIRHGSDSRDSHQATRNYGSRVERAAQKYYTKYNSWNGMEVRSAPSTKAVDDGESDVCSPPLWKASPPRSPQRRAKHYRSLSPGSRTEVITRGQEELMEMVRNMPESCYELTLKDIVEVEQPLVEAPVRETMSEEKNSSNEVLYKRESSKKVSENRALVRRGSGAMDRGGLYLKMGFPLYLWSKKKNKKNNPSVTITSAKVSPKPPVPDGSAKGVEKEWWKKRITASAESESGRSSSNGGSLKSSGSGSSSSTTGSSNSNSSRSRSRSKRTNSRRHGNGGCWSFICGKKKQN